MINFHELQPVVNDRYSFVGIDKSNSQPRLCLPKGFEPKSFNTYESKRDIFFLLYKVLRQFTKICEGKGYLNKSPDRDGVTQNSGGTQKITVPNTEDEEDNIFYSKLDSIGSILDAYDEPKIISLAYRLRVSEDVDYSKLHKFLHRAVYLNNGAAYIDSMTISRQQVQHQATDIVGMYCYIYWEIKQQLDEEVSSEIRALAEDFSHRYVGSEYSLFNEEYCTLTVDLLKDTLELINRHTPLKDSDYWQFYDAIELFLYGELSQQGEGKIWGIKDFHSVWESILLTVLVQYVDPEFILYLDTRYLSTNLLTLANSQPKIIDLSNVFVLNNKNLIPDAVIFSNPFYRVESNSNITLQQSNWDDFSYQTGFFSDLDYFRTSTGVHLKIAHHGQLRNRKHTFNELEKLYNTQHGRLVIDSQLPYNFYSYWEIRINKLDDTILALMKKLNHVFYVAIKNGAITPNSFYYFLVNRFNVNKPGYLTNYNPFRDSMLLGCQFTHPAKLDHDSSASEIVLMFDNFLKAINSCFKIIDAKYLEASYFFEEDNRKVLKERSVRKQFVYEYLLQKHIEKNDNFKGVEIRSVFSTPYWDSDSKNTEQIWEYMDGYMGLVNINVAACIDWYFD